MAAGHAPEPSPLRLAGLGLAAAGALLALLALALGVGAQSTVDISSAGPLENVWLAEDLSCQVSHRLDGATYELYPSSAVPGDCGTFLRIGSTLFGPSFTTHSGSATSFIAGGGSPTYAVHTYVSQSGVGGAGTSSDPYHVETDTAEGTTGVTIHQVDSYIVGDELYTTKVTVTNGGSTTLSLRLWRAGDCYLGATDVGYGLYDASSEEVGCSQNAYNTPPGRIEVWRPKTPGSNYLEDSFGTIWSTIASGSPFPDTCACGSAIDNGAGLSWDFTLAAGESKTFEHDLLFSPTGVIPSEPPTADLTVDDSARDCIDSTVRFATTAEDTDGVIASWVFAYGDGDSVSGSGTPPAAFSHVYAFAGTYTASLTVTDSDGLLATVEALVVSVGDPNCCPELQPLFDLTVKEGREARLAALAFDPDHGVLEFSIDPEKRDARMDAALGTWAWRTTKGDAGDHVFTLSVTDGICPVTTTFQVHVLGGPAPPPIDDQDQDGVADDQDNCPSVPNQDQLDANLDGRGDACTAPPEWTMDDDADDAPPAAATDADHDGVLDVSDVCPAVPDTRQADLDLDRLGDACDGDADGDGVPEAGEYVDVCPRVPDPAQADDDHDGIGDACDPSTLAARRSAQAAAGKGATGAGGPIDTAGLEQAPSDVPVALIASIAGASLLGIGLTAGLVVWVARRAK